MRLPGMEVYFSLQSSWENAVFKRRSKSEIPSWLKDEWAHIIFEFGVGVFNYFIDFAPAYN